MRRISLAVLLTIGLSACATSAPQTDSFPRLNDVDDVPTISHNQVEDRQILNDPERAAVEEKLELRELESHLSGREARQYARIKYSILSDRERIEFLQLGSYEARQRWALSHGFDGSDPYSEGNFGTLNLGMTKMAVKDAWGDPELIEVAGNPTYGNERWRYSREIPTETGFTRITRIIYFEAGRVRGWQTIR